METLSLVTVLIVYVGCLASYTDAYSSLGCYQDGPTDRDLANQVTLTDYNVDTCVAKCLNDGFAYAGLQPALLCFCDNRYGKHGTATGCTTDCGTAGRTCGGTNKSDIYYTVKNNEWTGKELEYGYKADSKIFEDARKACILPAVKGELAAVTKATAATIATKLPAGGVAWVGIWRKNSYFAFVDENMGNFTEDDVWAGGIPSTGDCVYLSQADSKLRADSCTVNYPYICETLKPTPTTNPNPTIVKTNPQEQAIKDWFNNSTNITMYIVLPIFGLCYGGSCLLYALAKLYRNCRKKQRQKMIAQSRADLLSDVRPIEPVKTLKVSASGANDAAARKPLPKIPERPPPYEKKNITHRKKDVSKSPDHPEKSALLKSQSSSPESNRSDSNRVRTPVNLFLVDGASRNDSPRVSSGESGSKRLRTPLQTNQVSLEERNKTIAPVPPDHSNAAGVSEEGKPKFKDAANTMRDQYFYMKALEIAARRRRDEEERHGRMSNMDDEIYDDSTRSRPITSNSSISGDKHKKRRKMEQRPIVDEEGMNAEVKPKKKKKKKRQDDEWSAMLTDDTPDQGHPPTSRAEPKVIGGMSPAESRLMSIDEIIQAKIMAAQKTRRKKKILAS